MAGIPGRLLGLQTGGVFISCEIACTFNFQVAMLAASAIDSGGWAEFISGLRSWTVSVDGQLLAEAVGADFKTILNAVYSRQPIFLVIGTRPSATTQMTVSGSALPVSGSFSGPGKGVATWTALFQGTGKPTTSFQDYALIIDAMPAIADYPTIVDVRVL